MQTAADYSVQVDDWPPDKKDPAEIKKFFEQFGSVYAVTVVVENATLLNWLAQAISQSRPVIRLSATLDFCVKSSVPRYITPSFSKQGKLAKSAGAARTANQSYRADLPLRK